MAVRIWLISHTEVTSRDSIGYQRYAWELEQDNWKHVLQKNVHHPLYPLSILAISAPVRQVVGGSELTVMQLSAQLASGLAGILLVIPMFFLGKELFDRTVGFWASAIFQCLPVEARVMSDALSESLFLLMSATALLLAVRAFRTGSWRQFGLCGLFAGLAYLTRPEGILIVAAVIFVLVARQLMVAGQASRIAKSLASLIIGLAILAGPYMAMIRGFSNKTTTQDVLQNVRRAESSRPAFEISCSIFDISCLLENQFRISNKEYRISRFSVLAIVGLWWPDGKVSDGLGHLGWSLYALSSEISKGFFYVAWIPALLGLFTLRARGPAGAGRLVLIVLCLLQCLALLRVAFVAGYVADRHVLIVVLCGLYWAVAAAFHLTKSVRAASGQWLVAGEGTTGHWPLATCHLCAVLLFLILIGLALPKTLATLHANRAGHHAVGLWLAEHVTSADEVDDPFCWAAHYAGRTFCRHPDGPVANVPGSECAEVMTRYRYVVHECRPDHREHFRKPSFPVADLLAAGGKIVYHWPERQSLEDASILLFCLPLPFRQQAEKEPVDAARTSFVQETCRQ
jgi:hypothetical protein